MNVKNYEMLSYLRFQKGMEPEEAKLFLGSASPHDLVVLRKQVAEHLADEAYFDALEGSLSRQQGW